MKKTLLFFLLIFSLSVSAQEENTIRGVQSPTNPNIAKGQTWAIVIGISDYQNIQDLRFADRDAMAFSNFLLYDVNVPSQQIQVFLNEQATRFVIIEAIDQILKKVKQGDKFYFYFAGHGDLEAREDVEHALLLLHDAPKINYLNSSEILEIGMLKSYLDKFLAKKVEVILISDACHAGKWTNSGASISYLQGVESNLLRIVACQANEKAQESDKFGGGRGLFSYHFIKGLREGLADENKDKKVNGKELRNYLEKNVSMDSDNQQNPDFLRYALFDFNVKDSLKKNEKVIYKILNTEDSLLSKTNKNNQQIYAQFKKLIASKRYLTPEKNSAYSIMKSLANISTEEQVLKRNAEIILGNAIFQEISGSLKTLMEGQKCNLLIKDFEEMSKKIAIIENLIGKNHLLSPLITARKLMIDAYIILLNGTNAKGSSSSAQKLALNKLNESLKYDEQPFTLLLKANTLKNLNKRDSAIQVFFRCKKLLPNSAKIYRQIGWFYFDDAKRALAYLDSAIHLDNTNAYFYASKASIYAVNSEKDSANYYAQKTIQLDSTYYAIYMTLANNGLFWGDSTIIFDNLNKAMRLLKQYPENLLHDGITFKYVYGNAANVLMAIPHYKEAVEYYQKAILEDTLDYTYYLNLAQVYMKIRDFPSSKRILEKVQKIEPKQPHIFRTWGDYYVAQKDYLNAVLKYKETLLMDSSNIDAYVNLGKLYLEQREDSVATIYLNLAAQRDSTNYLTFSDIGNAYNTYLLPQRGIGFLKKSIQLNPKFTNSWGALANSYYYQMEFKEAIETYQQVIKLDSTMIDGYYGLGNCYEQIGDFGKSKEYFQKCLNKKSLQVAKLAGCNVGIGNALQREGKYQEAIGYFEATYPMKPINWSAFEYAANCYLSLKDTLNTLKTLQKAVNADTSASDNYQICAKFLYQKLMMYPEAEKYFFKAIKNAPLKPSTQHTYFFLGDMYLHTQRYKEAIVQYKKAYELRTKDSHRGALAEIFNNMAVCYYNLGDYQHTIEAAQKATELNPALPNGYFQLMKGLLGLKKYQDAYQLKAKLIELQPDNFLSYYYAALVTFNLEKFDESINFCKQLIKLIPNSPIGFNLCGNVCLKQKRNKEAEEQFLAAYKLAPKQNDISYNIACLKSLSGNSKEALKWLEESLKNGFNNFKHIEQDTDLDNIRQSPEFQTLIYTYFKKK